MIEKEFIEQLKGIPSPKEAYKHLGVDEDFISETFEGYNPKQKTSSVKKPLTDDPLIRLIANYDMTKTEIGMISFGENVTDSDDYFYVGRFEADYLCISKTSKEVVILAFDAPLRVAYKCGRNSFLFLDALLVAARFMEQCMLDDDLAENSRVICATAETCTELSGHYESLNFYKVLLGCDY